MYNFIVLAFFCGLFFAPTSSLLEVSPIIALFAMILAFFYLYIVRRLVKPVIPMLLAHILIPILAWNLSSGVLYTLIYTIFSLIIVVFSLYQRHRQATTFSSEFIYFAKISLIIVILLATYFGHGYLTGFYIGLIITITIGARLHIRMIHVHSSLEIISQASSQRIQNILSFDHKVVFILSIILIGLILLLNAFIFTPFLDVISSFRPNINIEINTDAPDTEADTLQSITGDARMPPEMTDRNNEPAFFWRILEWVGTFVIIPVLGLMIVYLILTKIRNLINVWRLQKYDNPNIDNTFADEKEFIRTRKSINRWWKGRVKEHRLRRLYKEIVTRHIKKAYKFYKQIHQMKLQKKSPKKI